MAHLPKLSREPRPLTIAAVAVCGVLACGFLGGITNSVNGAVSPEYFVIVLRWHAVQDVWRASIAQGIFEGLLFGLVFSLTFTVTTGIITGAACSFGFATKHMLGIFGAAIVCWAAGGTAAVALASFSPEFFRRTFAIAPQEFGPMLRFAWVGGSIWGVELGGFASIVVGLVLLRANWRRQLAESCPLSEDYSGPSSLEFTANLQHR